MKVCGVEDCSNRVEANGLCSKHRARFRRHGDVTYRSSVASGEPFEWLEKHVGHDGPDCLIWPFGKGVDGQGRVNYQGARRVSSRVMCSLAHGPEPVPGMDAAHSCGNGHLGCVNPKHLRWATHLENMADAVAHQTTSRGSSRWNATLSEQQVREIRELVASGLSQPTVAATFGVTANVVSQIVLRKRWGWLS